MMTATISVVLMALFPVFARPRSTVEERWRLRRCWAAGLSAAWIVSNGLCVFSRGWSRGSLLIAAATFGWFGLILVALTQVPEMVRRPGGRRLEIIIRAALRPNTVGLSAAVLIWSLLTPVFGLVPLQYAGVFVGDPVDAHIASFVALGQFEPLDHISNIAVGQCVTTRQPKATNVVVPCGHPHDSEIVASVDPVDDCPDISEFDTGNYLLRMLATEKAYRGFVFCAIQFLKANRHQTLGQSIPRLGLAPTI